MTPATRRVQPKLLIGVAVVVLALAYLVLTAAQGSTAYYMTVAEVKAQGASAGKVRVAGEIRGDTIRWDARNLLLSFDVGDESGTLSVVYQGPRPDMFRDGATVVLEGRLDGPGPFKADTLLLKCPSKYEGS